MPNTSRIGPLLASENIKRDYKSDFKEDVRIDWKVDFPIAADAAFTADVLTGVAPLSVAFTSQTTGTMDTYAWDFGDGTDVDTTAAPTHVYAVEGTYTVVLTVAGKGGTNVETKVDYIDVVVA